MGIKRQNKRVNRFQALARQKQEMEYKLKGEGLYVYRNASKISTLDLPKPTATGKKVIQPLEVWEGDNYYMYMVKNNEARLVRTIITPEEEREKLMREQKLILDQPDVVTTEGVVERVVVELEKEELLTEEKPNKKTKKRDTLINESPVDGIEIING